MAKDLIPEICKVMGYQGEIVRNPARKSDVACHKGSDEKMNNAITLSLTPFDQGLHDTIHWYKDHIKA